MKKLNANLKFGIGLLLFCCAYWLLDSLWAYFSFEKNLSYLIFREPMSYRDTLLLKVSPYQAVSRIMVVTIFIITGLVTAYFFRKSRKTEYTARVQRDFLNTLHETLPNPVFYKDSSGRYSGCNSAYEAFIGLRRDQLVGRTVADLASEELADLHRQIDLGLFQSPGVRHYEARVMRRDGQQREVIFDKATIVGKDGKISGLIGIITDVTDLKRAEAEKMQLERQLMQTHKLESLGTLAGGIAHDFNNILFGLMGFTELCMDDTHTGTILHENLLEIQSGCMRAKDLVKQILTFSRRTEKQIQLVDVADLVKEASKLLRATIPATIALIIDIEADNSTIQCDATQIHQVIMNLCTNAVQAMEDRGGTLTVALRNVHACQLQPSDRSLPCPSENYLKLTVRDTGMGISDMIRERIFDPFFTSKEQGKGIGMGLAVVHGIVRSHRGFITVDSAPERGTVFEAFFPLFNPTFQETDNQGLSIGRH